MADQQVPPWLLAAAQIPGLQAPDVTAKMQMQAAQVAPGEVPPLLRDPNANAAPASALDSYIEKPLAKTPVMQPAQPGVRHDQESELVEAYGKNAKEAMAAQGADLSSLNEYINQIGQKPTGVNWTPLAAYIDSVMPGSKLTEAAKATAPMSQEDKDKQLFDMRKQLAGGRAALSTENVKALGQQIEMMRNRERDAESRRHNLATEDNFSDRTGQMGTGGRTGVMLGNQAIQAGKDFENTPIVKVGKASLSSLARSISILDNTEKPLTSKDLNLAYTDYINSVAAGGAATEGKISRELPETFAQQLNEFRQKFGDNVDLRSTPAGRELVDMLRKNIHTVRHDIGVSISDQAADIETTYGAVQNPLVHQTVAAKKARYGDPERNANFAQPRSGAAPTQNLHDLSDDELHKLWLQKQGK